MNDCTGREKREVRRGEGEGKRKDVLRQRGRKKKRSWRALKAAKNREKNGAAP